MYVPLRPRASPPRCPGGRAQPSIALHSPGRASGPLTWSWKAVDGEGGTYQGHTADRGQSSGSGVLILVPTEHLRRLGALESETGRCSLESSRDPHCPPTEGAGGPGDGSSPSAQSHRPLHPAGPGGPGSAPRQLPSGPLFLHPRLHHGVCHRYIPGGVPSFRWLRVRFETLNFSTGSNLGGGGGRGGGKGHDIFSPKKAPPPSLPSVAPSLPEQMSLPSPI